MFKSIIKIKSLLKIINFTNKKEVIIKHGGSEIILTEEGDIIIKAKRNLINKYELLFQDCEEEVIKEITKAKKENRLEEYLEEKNDKEILEKARCLI